MADRKLGDQVGGGGDADELLRELIPDSSQHGNQGETTGELPTWGGAPIPADEAIAGSGQTTGSGSHNPGTVPLSGQTGPAAGGDGPLLGAQSAAVGNGPDPGPRGPGNRPPAAAQASDGRRDPRWLTLTLAVVAALALMAAAFQAGILLGDSESDETATLTGDPVDEDVDGGEDADPAAPTTETGEELTVDVETDDSGDSELSTAAGTASSIRLSLDNYRFTVDGVVPSEEIKAGIEERMGMVFAEFGSSTLAVDPDVSPADWLAEAPSLVNTMILLHNGTIDITEGGVDVSGRALASDFAKLEGTLTPERGFPALTISDQEVVDKEAPWVRAIAGGDGTLTLTGELADETMRSTIVEGVEAVYGAENVTDVTVVNPERHNRFLIMRFPSNVAAYKAFGAFDIRGENESFTAILENGLVFESLQTELTPDSRERLAGVMFTLTRNPLPVTVTGHTDSTGSEADNQELSERRAESVAAFLIDNGVLPENIETSGLGETDPVADNDSDEGRARNRRVEIVVGLYN